MLNFEKITKEWILSKITEIEIFSYYLPLPIETIEYSVNNTKLICSPLRADKNPTCGFYIKNNKLRFNDLAGYFHGDCFDVVAYHKNLNSNDRRDFNKILEIIAIDFKLIKGGISTNTINILTTNLVRKEKPIIDVQYRTWDNKDIQYWKKGGVSINTLENMEVRPVYVAWINSEILYSFSYKDLCYSIRLGSYNNIMNWKLYFPFRDSYRFITNSRYMMNLNLIKKAKFGIITKSFKDVAVFRQIGIEAVSVAGETIYPLVTEIDYIKQQWGTVIVLMDFDYTGIKMTQHLKKQYGFKYNFFTNGRFNTYDFEVKDAFEFTTMYNTNTLIELIRYLIDNKVNTSDYFDFLKYLLI